MAKILCIEDEPCIRELLIDNLQDAGYETIEAENGAEALAVIIEHKPDLVLCDITMPVMNGYELLEVVRKDHPEFAEMPFIFLSGLAGREDVVAGKQLGSDDYLTKPVDFDIMRATVKARLDQIRRIDQQKQIEFDELRASVLRMLPHELRTPLNHIIGFSEMMRNQMLGPIGNEQYLEWAGNIHEGGLRLLSTIENALQLVDLMSGELKPVMRECDVASMVQACLDEVADAVSQAQVVLSAEPPCGLLSLWTDEHLLKTILKALLSNAIKFTPAGGTVRVRVESRSDGSALLAVIDTGMGIAAEDIPKSFKSFSQANGGMTRKYEGAGLGLTLANELTELLGGTLDLESEIGVGTTVTVCFPAEQIVSQAATGT